MSKLKKAEESAFPFENDGLLSPGLTKLEYFAGLAMQGLLFGRAQPISTATSEQIATMASSCAKALIAELDKQP